MYSMAIWRYTLRKKGRLMPAPSLFLHSLAHEHRQHESERNREQDRHCQELHEHPALARLQLLVCALQQLVILTGEVLFQARFRVLLCLLVSGQLLPPRAVEDGVAPAEGDQRADASQDGKHASPLTVLRKKRPWTF